MATPEQRKEIASRLRNPDSLNSEGCIITAGICLKISSTLIADLIDPTCDFEECYYNDEFALRLVSGYICHNCGHEAIVERCTDGWAEPPHYCPNCGARVVEQ